MQGKTVANMFFENSTRTRLSFELAERRLSADVLGFAASGSSVSKGETLKDTARNIEAMKVDMVVMRHAAAGAPDYLSRIIEANVINAGDGSHEHPTQALLDMYTIREKLVAAAGPARVHRGRYLAQPRGALEHLRPEDHGCTGVGVRARDDDPARHRTARRRSVPPHR